MHILTKTRTSLCSASGKKLQEMQEMRVQSPGGGNGNPYQYSCLENSRDRGAWLATVRGAAKSWS